MAKLVSEIDTALTQYKHPDIASFNDVLNEVLPRLASMGIWRDLTYEQSIILDADQGFYSLPESAESILYAMRNNDPAPTSPLWQDYITIGGSTQRSPAQFGVIDAGYGPTKEVLAEDTIYCLFAFPSHNWGIDETTYTRSALAGTETIKIQYENFEGVYVTQTTTLAASADAQVLLPRAVKNIISIEFTGITVPVTVVAVPVEAMGLFDSPGAGAINIDELSGQTASYDSFLSAAPSTVIAYSATNTNNPTNPLSYSTLTSTSITGTGYGGASPVTDEPVVLFKPTIVSDVLLRTDNEKVETDGRIVANLDGPDAVVRYRRFRLGGSGTTLHALFRRKIERVDAGTDIVYIDNLNALKHAILAHTAEYNSDRDAAREEWALAKKALDDELGMSLGGQLPKLNWRVDGGSAVPTIM